MVIKKTENTIETLKNILNGMDAYIYVSDPETDEILFINEGMRKHFNLKETSVAELTCWKVLQNGFDSRCSFCPVHKLNKNPDEPVIWEEHNTLTGRYYKNTDSLIEWTGGRKVHLQHSIDITQLKLTEQTLEKRVAQQKLMTAISKVFISGEPIEEQINKALRMAGEFMDISSVKFYRYSKSKQTVDLLNMWIAPPGMPLETISVPFKEGNELYEAFVLQEKNFMIVDNVISQGNFPVSESMGVKSFMAMPVSVGESFWGILVFDNLSLAPWSESNIQLGKLMSSILSGSIQRINAEKSLFRMSSLVNSSPQYISCTNRSGQYTYVNPAMMKITGYSKEELFKAGLGILNKENVVNDNEYREKVLAALEKDGQYLFENVIATKYGTQLVMLMSLFFIDEQKSEIGCIAIDITEQRRLESELISARDIAEKASQAKGEFLARMSHEIRTPINAIMGMTTIAKNTDDISRKDYCLEKIDDASSHLLGIINDILDMSKIEANKLELTSGEFNLEKMVEKAVNVVNFRIEQKQQNIVINIGSSIPKTIIGDEMRLNQVIINLLTNASKFTPEEGSIRLNIIKFAQEGRMLTLKFEVQDNGIGISKEQQENLFKSFEQADGSISRKFGGTGLGLAICKRIVELMGGRITVESELNKGAKFIFTIQAEKGMNQSEIKLNPDINVGNLRVLAVDDSSEIRDYFENIMAKFSIYCDVAPGAREALSLIEQNKNEPYNIFFIDWMMPGIDGIELARMIKQSDVQNCIIIMISTAKWAEIEEEAIGAGVDKFIGKPLFPSALINIINESFSGGVMLNVKTEPGSQMSGKKPNFEGQHILVAEDTEINREIIKAFLQNTKVKIDFAVNGAEAVESFKSSPDKYNAILMDVQMPKMDGLQATRAIRALDIERAKTIPIIALTANVFKEDIEECLSAGMNSHIGKPIDMSSMFVTLTQYMKDSEAEENLKADTGSGQKGYSEFAPFIDVEDGLGRLMNDKKLYFQLLKSFDAKKLADELIAGINAGDFKAAAVAAHTIKGIAANLGLTSLWELSKEVEAQAKAQNNLSSFVESINNITGKTLDAIEILVKS